MRIFRYISILILLIITGCTSQLQPVINDSTDQRLGTQWGEGLQSSVKKVNLKRIEPNPINTLEIAYSAQSIKGPTIKEIMLADGKLGLSILNEKGQRLLMQKQGNQIHLQGKEGDRYILSYHNYDQNTIYEIITTVDGLDVINGTAGSFKNAGYALYPNKTLSISGFRKNSNEVAAFRFAKAHNTYAANTPAGDIKNIGVIGTAIFTLVDPTKPVQIINQARPNAFPNETGYAPAPRYTY